jgi:RNA polymerase sigma-70 factor (ECF subfamily)
VRRPKVVINEDPIVLSAKEGNERAFMQLVTKYEQTVYSFAFKVCRSKEKAEETLQDTFINVYRKLAQFDGRSKFTTWLYRIVVNNCLMKNRRGKMDHALTSLEELSSDTGISNWHRHFSQWRDTPLDRAMNHELRELLDDAVERLPMDHRTVFILRDIEGQSAEETAQILQLSIPAVKSRLRRARIYLREQLDEYMKA